MFSARRVYVYLVSLISFATVIFAAISLLQNLLTSRTATSVDLALQIAILIIATPIYLGHWIWQQGKVAQDEEERGVLLRRIYLYVIVGGAVAVAAVNVFDLLQWALDIDVPRALRLMPAWQVLVYYLIPVAVAAGTWVYHTQLLRRDQDDSPDTGARGSVHRLYLYLFSAAGLIMVSIAVVEILRWLLSAVGDTLFNAGTLDADLMAVIPQIAVGLILWLVYWLSAQRLYRAGDAEERGSILRKFYLYTAIFVGVAGSVSAAAMLLSGIFQTWLGLSPEGDIRNSLALIAVFVALWFYHSRVLAEDAQAAEQTAQQAEIRRIYLYLLSGIGLAALLVGIIGDISTLLYIVDEGISNAHRISLSYFSAALIAGLPVWFLAWRKAQQEAARTDKTGSQARDSLVRKIYLYFFLFVSIISVLGSAIYVLWRILDWFLSGHSLTLIDIAIPLTIAVAQMLVWVYHFAVLRSDRRLSAQDEVRQLADIRLVLVDSGDSAALHAIAERLRKAAPGADIQLLEAEDLATAQAEGQPSAVMQVQQAEVIVAPWTLFAAGRDAATGLAAAAVAESSAQKIVLPDAALTWSWVGMESLSEEEAADETLNMLKQIVAGEEIKSRRRLGCGGIALIIIGLWFLLSILSAFYVYFTW